MLTCVGFSNLQRSASCPQSMGQIVGETVCETFAKPLGANGCKTPLNVLIPKYCP